MEPTNAQPASASRQESGSAAAKESFFESNKFVLLVLLVILGIILFIIYGVVSLLDKFLTAEAIRRSDVRVAVTLSSLVGAIVLYRIKVSSLQVLYGLTEVAVGIFANWRSLGLLSEQLASPGTSNPILARLAVLAGGVYLIGRGITNVVEGVKRLESPKEQTQKS